MKCGLALVFCKLFSTLKNWFPIFYEKIGKSNFFFHKKFSVGSNYFLHRWQRKQETCSSLLHRVEKCFFCVCDSMKSTCFTKTINPQNLILMWPHSIYLDPFVCTLTNDNMNNWKCFDLQTPEVVCANDNIQSLIITFIKWLDEKNSLPKKFVQGI